MVQSLFVCRWLLTGGTVIPVSLIATVPTVLEKSVFYGYLAVASVSLALYPGSIEIFRRRRRRRQPEVGLKTSISQA